MSQEQAPVCTDERRRAAVRGHQQLNGIDYVEVSADDHKTLRVFLLNPVPPADPADPGDPDDAYGLSANPTRIAITGGTRIVGIRVTSVTRQPAGPLEVTVDRAGDFSTYTLTIDAPGFDPVLCRVRFSFMAGCPVEFDCRRTVGSALPALPEPALDYLAKDYASFRRLLLDLLPQINPRFVERSPADLGVALLELLAYAGDHLSYFQDAVANEAYLETLRHRISARRHARLIDYRMHDGRNAWTYVHVAVRADGELPQGTRILTRVVAPLLRQSAPPGAAIEPDQVTADALERDPALASTAVFETTHPASLHPANNEIVVHTWGDEECCLRPGTTEAFLYRVAEDATTVERPVLAAGDYLLLEEVKGRLTGIVADADPSRRQVVRIEEVAETEDPLYRDMLADGAPQPRQSAAQPALPLLRVRWRPGDALRVPLCLSTRHPATGLFRNVSVARGNVVLADHGLTLTEAIPAPPPEPADRPFRPRLTRGPLTRACVPVDAEYDTATGCLKSARHELSCDVREARPALALRVAFPSSAEPELWTPVPDLLDSPPFEAHFVAEVDDEGRAVLRFGDGEYGKAIAGAASVKACYRIGNGRAGNVGAEALAHVAVPAPGDWVVRVRNPLPAGHGVDPETIEEVRERAPRAVHAPQLRAVTEADYAEAARTRPDIAGAAASFRWTGSWYAAFVGVDPRSPADLVNEPGGRTRLAPGLERSARAHLGRYRLAGYDLDVRSPRFVPLEIALDVCAAAGHFRTEVARAVIEALGTGVLPDGRRGFFHPDHFTFGQSVYLSQLYAAVERVEGVDSAVVRTFRRFGEADNGELARGEIPIGSGEIARLENDPNFMEHGVVRVVALGGKA